MALARARRTRRARGVLGGVILLLGSLSPLAAQPGADVDADADASLRRTVTAAFSRGDFETLRAALAELSARHPADPNVRYQLAAALAITGATDAALRELERLADQGLSYAPHSEPAFASLAGMPRFAAVAGRLRGNAEPAGEAALAFSVGDPGFMPEGLAYDPDSQSFFLGSVRERRILRVDRQGRATPFVEAGAHGLWSVLGLAVDPRRRLLWVASSAFPQMQGFDPLVAGRAALFAFALDGGALRRRVEAPADLRQHAFGDVRVLSDGAVVVSDAAAGQLYRLADPDSELQPLLGDDGLRSPQGFVEWTDGSLIIADYAGGLLRWHPDEQIGPQALAIPDDIAVYGIDGLYRHHDRLIAIQNGLRPHRVMALTPSPDGRRITRAQVIARALPAFDEPTLGTVVGGRLFLVGNSQWGRHDQESHQSDSGLQAPRILRVNLATTKPD